MMFSIIIPNFNSEKWIEKLLNSILNQTYTDYEIVIVDDMSTDDSVKIIKSFQDKRIKLIELETKAYNGGSRNIGVSYAKGKYILFADCDDWFKSNNCLEEIAKVIEEYNYPDCVRLPYHFIEIGEGDIMLHENSIEELANTVFVAPWTKCIKRELFVPFPENTLVEDIVQHIAQIDKIETLAYCPIPVIVWNRTNVNAISATGRKYNRDSKRYSSIFRNIADLLDLRCNHDYCERRRQQRIDAYLDMLHRGKEKELIEL